MFFKKSTPATQSEDEAAKQMALLGQFAGVGLWDAVLYNGDPMHPQSHWHWSDELRRLLGYAHGDQTGFPNIVSSWSDRLHPDDAGPTFASFSACLNDRTGRTGYDVVYRLRMKDNQYRWFRAVGGVARDAQGRPLRACGSLIDIHDQKSQLERMELLDQHAGVGLWDAVMHEGDAMHPNSRWRWSNEFRRLAGFRDQNDFPDRVNSWSDRLHPEDAGPTFAAFGACMADTTGRTPYDVTYRMKIKDGSYRWFRAVGGVARDAQGRPLRACGSLIDVHDQKTAELKQLDAEKERRRTILDIADTLTTRVENSADRANSNTQTVASATEELSASIAEISERANNAAAAAANASTETGRTNEAVQALVTASERIGVVVKLINDIASQTNLLALNATIEAARAGDAGKGFAVVATEVKSLAKQTASATDEIAEQISSVQQEANRAVAAIRSIGAIINEVQGISATIASAVAQQDAATREIAGSVSHVARDIGEVTENVREVTQQLRRSGQ